MIPAIHNQHVVQYYNDIGDAAQSVGYCEEAMHFYARAQWEESLEELFTEIDSSPFPIFDTKTKTDIHPINKTPLRPEEESSF